MDIKIDFHRFYKGFKLNNNKKLGEQNFSCKEYWIDFLRVSK